MKANSARTILGFASIGAMLGSIWLLRQIFLEAYGFSETYWAQASFIFADQAKQLGINAAELYKTGGQLVVQKAFFQYAWSCLGPTTIGGAVIGWIITMCTAPIDSESIAPMNNSSTAHSTAAASSADDSSRAADKEVPMDKEERSEFISTKQPIQEKT